VIGRGRILADDALESLLAGQGTTVRGVDPTALDRALRTAGFETKAASGGALRVQATAEQVGRVALDSRQILLELHEGDSSGLEELFFELTATASATTTTTDDGQASAA